MCGYGWEEVYVLEAVFIETVSRLGCEAKVRPDTRAEAEDVWPLLTACLHACCMST